MTVLSTKPRDISTHGIVDPSGRSVAVQIFNFNVRNCRKAANPQKHALSYSPAPAISCQPHSRKPEAHPA